MSNDKLWRPGTEVPGEPMTRAIVCRKVTTADEDTAALEVLGVATCYLGRGSPQWDCCHGDFFLKPSAAFWWIPLDALTDILIAEYDIEVL